MKNVFLFAILAVLAFVVNSCDESSVNPNDLGGNADVGFTRVGDRTGAWVQFGDDDDYVNVKDSIVVIKNDNGIVTSFARFEIDTSAALRLDTLLGIQDLSRSAKFNLLNVYFKKYGVSLDTSNKSVLKLSFEFISKVTSEGIQDYTHGGNNLSKPFTLVKYASNVGDKYEFTDLENIKIKREVVYKSTTNDFEVVFWKIKVIKIEETKEDPMFQKITYVANHKFGLVGIIFSLKNGNTVKFTFSPANM